MKRNTNGGLPCATLMFSRFLFSRKSAKTMLSIPERKDGRRLVAFLPNWLQKVIVHIINGILMVWRNAMLGGEKRFWYRFTGRLLVAKLRQWNVVETEYQIKHWIRIFMVMWIVDCPNVSMQAVSVI